MQEINYSQLIDQSMRGMVREIIRKASKEGLPGEHHFYVSFRTDHPLSRVSENLRARYPNDITIVIQHQFWDFTVEEDKFHVTLSFGGVPEKNYRTFCRAYCLCGPKREIWPAIPAKCRGYSRTALCAKF